MKITVGKTSGFCFGVKRAVETAFQNADKNICMLGPIIHNQSVINELNTKNVGIINNLSEADNRTVLIRAHGVPKETYSQLKNLGINYIDCTCPFVKRISQLVEKNFNDGKKIIIIGNPNHPEIIGINSYAQNQAVIINNIDAAKKFHNDKNLSCLLVAQTTFSSQIFDEIIKILHADNIEIQNTICNTTYQRQQEARNLAKISDKMIVIGDKSSSNSTKLFNICQENCCNTFFIQSSADLLLINFRLNDRIGVMAGASTPLHVIEEAVFLMNQLAVEEKSFAQMLEESFVNLHIGEIVKGKVIQVSDNEIVLDLGYKSDGIISRDNFSTSSHCYLKDLVNIGDEIEAIVLKIDDGEGNVILSKRKLDLQRGFKEIEKAFKENSIVTGKIIEVVKSGVVALADNVKLFIPASCISNSHIKDLNSYVGKTLDFKIIEFNRLKHRYIGSCKEILDKEKNEENDLSNELKVGEEFDGIISKIVNFGIFVNVGNWSGLVHLSELGWDRKNDTLDKFKVGDKVKVFVLGMDNKHNKISLTMKNPDKSPWRDISKRYYEGKIVKGKVARINNYGAFIELEPGIDGLLHISQISDEHVNNVNDKLKINDVVTLRVLSSDEKRKRVSLSMIDVK